MITENTWPPLYQIRYSARAKRPFLQVTLERGLEVVLPIRKRAFNVEQLLQEKRSWIEKVFKKWAGFLTHCEEKILTHPNRIEYQALFETWNIQYFPKPSSQKITLKQHCVPENILTLAGNTQDVVRCCKLLKKHFIKRAQIALFPWLQRLSLQTGLSFERVIIRGQSTLWGSCNARKTISLNYKLLFLPHHLVEHVLLHELCHTKHLNHSSRFWKLLQKWDENCDQNKLALKTAESYVPAWINSI